MSFVDLWQLASLMIPEAESPWPERIGPGLPFTVSGAASMLIGMVMAGSQEKRERAMNRGGVYGFLLGSALYMLVLLNQVAFR